MTRREIVKNTVGAVSAMGWGGAAIAAPKTLKNMGVASPGIRARIQATRAAGEEFDNSNGTWPFCNDACQKTRFSPIIIYPAKMLQSEPNNQSGFPAKQLAFCMGCT